MKMLPSTLTATERRIKKAEITKQEWLKLKKTTAGTSSRAEDVKAQGNSTQGPNAQKTPGNRTETQKRGTIPSKQEKGKTNGNKAQLQKDDSASKSLLTKTQKKNARRKRGQANQVKPKHFCNHCQFKTNDIDVWKHHCTKVCPLIRCSHCRVCFMHRDKYRSHMERFHPQAKIKEPQVGLRNPRLPLGIPQPQPMVPILQTGIQRASDHVCQYCGDKFILRELYEYHILEHKKKERQQKQSDSLITRQETISYQSHTTQVMPPAFVQRNAPVAFGREIDRGQRPAIGFSVRENRQREGFGPTDQMSPNDGFGGTYQRETQMVSYSNDDTPGWNGNEMIPYGGEEFSLSRQIGKRPMQSSPSNESPIISKLRRMSGSTDQGSPDFENTHSGFGQRWGSGTRWDQGGGPDQGPLPLPPLPLPLLGPSPIFGNASQGMQQGKQIGPTFSPNRQSQQPYTSPGTQHGQPTRPGFSANRKPQQPITPSNSSGTSQPTNPHNVAKKQKRGQIRLAKKKERREMLLNDPNSRRYTCPTPTCEFETVEVAAYNRHQEKSCKNQFLCRWCLMGFWFRDELDVHRETHKVFCQYCKMSSYSQSQLMDHMMMKHSAKIAMGK